ncbi:hypothetical protein EC2875150_5518 [Escherichia coli 2875150]|nr:hypothetical protein EC2875150_5518 [Escherichia coli 2875150]
MPSVSEAPAVLHPAASVPESVHLYGKRRLSTVWQILKFLRE